MEILSSFAETVIRNLWAVSWQVTILVAIIWIVDRLSRRASSVFRYWLWCIVLFRLLIPINLATPFGAGQFIWQSIGAGAADLQKVIISPDDSDRFRFKTIPQANFDVQEIEPEFLEQPEHVFPMTTAEISGLFWFAVVVCITLLILSRIVWVTLQLKDCRPVARPDLCKLVKKLAGNMGITRPAGLYCMNIDKFDIPAVIGIFRPRIFLPRRIADEWPLDDLEPVLLHELAHVKRYDLIINWLQVIVQVVYFFHPLVWYVNRRIRQIREEVCDDVAVNLLGTGKKRYTMSIVRVMEETLREPVFGFIGIGFTERKKSLGKRIKRILSNKYRIATKLTATSIMILFIIAVTGTFLSCSRSSSAQARKIKPEAIVQEEIEVEHTPMKEIPIYIASGWGKHLKPPDNLKRAIINLAEAVNKQTDFNVKVDTHLFLDQQKKFFETPFVYIMADEAFELTDIEKRSFGHYLRNGGFAVIDNAAPQYEFGEAEASLRQMLRDALGSEAKFLPIDKDHSLYHCHFDFDYGPPQGANLEAIIEGMTKEKKKFVRQIPFTKPLSPLEGIWIGNRLVAIYSDKGYCYRWAETGKNQPQLKFGVNMVVYALLQESGILNKKESELRSGSQSQERTKKLKVRSKSVIKIGEAGNIEESSDRVQLDGKLLIRGTDYRINYQTNEITLLNEKALSPSADLVVRYEEKENIIDK